MLQEAGELFPKRQRVLAGLADCAGRQGHGLRCLDRRTNFVQQWFASCLTPDMAYSYQNQDAPRSGARPAALRPAHNSAPAASAISWPPTPPAPNDQPKKLVYAFSSNAVSLDG